MSLPIKFHHHETKEELFDTKKLKDFTPTQLIVLIQQLGWELKERGNLSEKEGENSVPKRETVSLEKPRMVIKENTNDSLQNSRPESKIWKLIDKWKKEGLAPRFEICAGMLTVWGVETE